MMQIKNLDIENLDEEEVLEAFVFLNSPELEYNKINNFSKDLGKLIKWCQGIVSYHILIHPYIYRNENSQISPGSEVYEFAKKMDNLINRFYKFKRFLINLKITQIPLADYVFNLQHTRTNIQIVDNNNNNAFNNFSYQDIGFILSFLPYSITYKYIGLSKNFKNGFIQSVNLITFELLEEIYFFKLQSYDILINKIPIIYECNLFGKYFLMLDSILNSTGDNTGRTFTPFFTNEHLNNIKSIKKENNIVFSISKVFCVICNIPPERISTAKGEIKISYLEKIKKLIINGKFQKVMRYVNKLFINTEKLMSIKEEIIQYYSIDKLEEIKRINLGLYQLLSWELLVFEYLKTFNPFDFITSQKITSTYEPKIVKTIKYYIEIMNYLKYNLKIKYYFSNKISPIFDFIGLFENLKNYMIDINMYNENIFISTNENCEKIASIFFENRDNIFFHSKPFSYEKIITEIVAANITIRDNCYKNIINSFQKNKRLSLRENKILSSSMKCIRQHSKLLPYNTSIENFNKNLKYNQLGTIKEEHSTSLRLPSPSSRIINLSERYYNDINKDNNNSYTNVGFNIIPDNVIIKYMLFYLDINSLTLFFLINRKSNRCLKTHMFIRLYFLGREKKLIERENADIIASINQKRIDIYNEYDIPQPETSKAKNLISQITKDDLLKLKFFYKKYNKKYETLIAPFIVLLGKQPKNIYHSDGVKKVSFFIPAQQLLNEKDIVKKVGNYELETISSSIYSLVEQLLDSPDFSEEKVKCYSSAHQHMIHWVKGVIEFHRIIRNYSLSKYDNNILEQNEINFCVEMDNIDLLYFKLQRFAGKFCKRYEKKAKEIMSEMKIINDN